MKELGVIIPTYNRFEIVSRLLGILEKQDLARRFFSVTVIDDGSSDGTFVNLRKRKWKLDLKILKQKNSGQAKARNVALKAVQTKYILFLGDDILPCDNGFLRRHLRALRASDKRTAFLGFTTWQPVLARDRFRLWLEKGGPQFDYRGLKDGSKTDFWHFYTSNVSLPRALLAHEKFDEKFAGYGWEDVELAYRLVKKHSLQIKFLEQARAYHCHALTETSVWKRVPEMKTAGLYFERKHPEIRILPHGLKWFLLWFFTRRPVIFLARKIKPEWGWYLRFKREFL